MQIIISNTSGVPIYQQIVTQVRRMVMTGELTSGEPLPSMRQLARDLRISLITTKRAYEELEAMGLLATVGGKGCFVGAASPDALAEQHRLELERQLATAVATAQGSGVSLDDFVELATIIYNGGNE